MLADKEIGKDVKRFSRDAIRASYRKPKEIDFGTIANRKQSHGSDTSVAVRTSPRRCVTVPNFGTIDEVGQSKKQLLSNASKQCSLM